MLAVIAVLLYEVRIALLPFVFAVAGRVCVGPADQSPPAAAGLLAVPIAVCIKVTLQQYYAEPIARDEPGRSG